MLGHLAEEGYALTAEPDEADVLVLNTCGFIEEAKEESVDTIMAMVRMKEARPALKLVVTGCLVQRHAEELAQGIPEVDHYLGTGAYEDVVKALRRSAPAASVQVRAPEFLNTATQPRLNSFLPHSAYVKISEGCDQRCAFCIIPTLRGLQRSRSIDDVEREARTLAGRGVVELNLIAQDLTGYGFDQQPRTHLADLLARLVSIEELLWIRLHYLFPRRLPDRFYDILAHEKIAPYIDMPLQHAADPVLERMRRGPRSTIERGLERLRAARPDAAVRSSFIVGFPGETDADFRALCDFVEAQDFDHVGVFQFSREEGTPSFDMEDQVPPELIRARHHELMSILQARSRQRLARLVGRRLPVLVDGVSSETELLLEGRRAGQAPEVDGVVYINDGRADAGALVEVEITESFDYDVVGHIVRELRPAPRRPDHPRFHASSAARSRGSLRLPVLP
jgi:ribosomal protein S12 methylthiotransferase